MATPFQLVLFDVDGVLSNSLPQHLQICRDQAAAHGLSITILSADSFRKLVDKGVKISPMRAFYAALGFPEALLDALVAEYDATFSARYLPPLFASAAPTLRSLRARGYRLGLVTANTEANVRAVLDPVMPLFEDGLCRFFEGRAVEASKAEKIAECVARAGLTPERCLYVGDQPADAAAADRAGVAFLAVSYGWSEMADYADDQRIDDLAELPAWLDSAGGAAAAGLAAAE